MMFKVHPMLRRLLVLVLIFATSGVWAQRVLTTPDFTGFSERDGVGAPAIFRMLPLADGGVLLHGFFEVWYEGIRFRDLLKLRAGGEPDTSWRVELSPASNDFSIYPVTVTPYGAVIAGRFDTVNGVPLNKVGESGVAFVWWDATRPVSSPQLASVPDLAGIAGLLAYDKSTDQVYVDTRWGIQRLFAKNAVLDAGWRYVQEYTRGFPPYCSGSISDMVADSGGGLWIEAYCRDTYTISYATQGWRIAAAPNAAWKPSVLTNGRIAGTTAQHIYIANKRYRSSDGTVDSAWSTRSEAWLVSDKYVYLPSVGGPPDLTANGIARVATNGASTPENWLFPAKTLFDYRRPTLLAWPTPGDEGNLAVLVRKSQVDGAPPLLVLSVKEDLVGMQDPSVVEYYVPAAKRYFITGRKSEQALLDDPDVRGAFIRTGMRFTAKSSRYRDVPELPVCRLYAAPEKGGSNSHFYGMGDDCSTLNKLKGLKYEGFDFSVLKPGFGGCPADAPNPVSRLFNNKAASNDGNHRYVVSAATQSKMLTQGWADEGVVFCSTSVVDATN
jgi:hypothetical protein